jgi:hypothetical protein
MPSALRIGVIGDFEPAFHSHFATNAALYDARCKTEDSSCTTLGTNSIAGARKPGEDSGPLGWACWVAGKSL